MWPPPPGSRIQIISGALDREGVQGGGAACQRGAAVLGVCWLRAAAGDILFTPSLLYEKLTGNWEPFTRHT